MRFHLRSNERSDLVIASAAKQSRAPRRLDCFVASLLAMTKTGSGIAAVGAQGLRVDPAAFRTGQKGNHIGDVLGRAEPLHRWKLGQPADLLLVLAFEKRTG